MKIITNEKLIKRNSKIGGWLFLACVVVFMGGLYVNMTNISTANEQAFYLTLAAFLVGYIMMQISLYFMNRFGGRPRVDEKIDAALKGLPGDYSIYHFTAPASHVLVGPAGVWVLLPYRQRGVVKYEKNRWRVGNGGFLQAYMTIFGQEGIGRPDLEAENEVNSMRRLLAGKFAENEIPAVQAVLLFMNEQVEIQAEAAPVAALKIKQLKEFMRQMAKKNPIGQNRLAAVKAALPVE